MRKLLILLFALALVLSLTACGEEENGIPEDWDQEAKYLEFYNGVLLSKTVEDLRYYMTEDTTDEQMQTYIDENWTMIYDSPEVDFTMDTVLEMEVIDTYEGFQIVRVTITNTIDEEDPATIGPEIVPLKIQDDHYITSLEPTFQEQLAAIYVSCETCYASGTAQVVGAYCETCKGAGVLSEDPLAVQNGNGTSCPDCGGLGAEIISQECTDCGGKGYNIYK